MNYLRTLSKVMGRAVILLTAVVIFFSTSSCEPKLAVSSNSEPSENVSVTADEPEQAATATKEKNEFPVDVVIENQNGKTLEGTVLAKAGNEILFVRKADQKKYIVPIETLSNSDQTRFYASFDANEERISELRALNASVASEKSERPKPRQLSLHYENAESYADARQRAAENGTKLLLVFLAEPELSEDCTS